MYRAGSLGLVLILIQACGSNVLYRRHGTELLLLRNTITLNRSLTAAVAVVSILSQCKTMAE